MQATDYEYLSSFLLGNSGLELGDGKEYLIESRLVPLAQTLGLDDIEAIVVELRKGRDKRVECAVIEAMTTNETSFFRDKSPFIELREKLLPDLIDARQTTRSLRIWCAAASTGQEPYTIAMILEDSFPELRDWNVEIIATDIDSKVLARCEEGVYSQFEVQRGLPVELLMKHFEQVEKGWRIRKNLRDRIHWRQWNLLDDFSLLGQFDIVFCRNVLIYFQMETKTDILDRIAKQTRTDGYLYLGAAETVLGVSDEFRRFKDCKSAVYRPNAAFSTAVGTR